MKGAWISIHAPREGGDPGDELVVDGLTDFNPRPPRGGRHQDIQMRQHQFYFNPRPPRGGRPQLAAKVPQIIQNFNPRPPRGGRLKLIVALAGGLIISIHAPREGGD